MAVPVTPGREWGGGEPRALFKLGGGAATDRA
jgi:hypothetical protein